MRCTGRRLAAAVCVTALVLAAPRALGQDDQQNQQAPAIISEGQATLSAVPDYADFFLQFVGKGQSFSEANKQLGDVEKRVREAMDARKLVSALVDVSSVAIPDIGNTLGFITARIRFPLATLSSEKESAKHFAGLCDQVRALAKELGCSVTGPELLVQDKKALEGKAVARALENALPAAEAAATAMETIVTSVHRVEIKSLEWNAEARGKAFLPQMRRTTCTARVRVQYLAGNQ